MKKVEQLLSMNGGEEENSYATNSLIQKEAMFKAKHVLEESLREFYLSNIPSCLRIADFGCSSGPNTLQFVSEVIDVIHLTCRNFNSKEPLFQVFLNDLPGNDFNTLFRSFPSFYEKLEKDKGSDFGPCFIAGIPGTFYGRLFPDNFLHFAHSCYSLHWLPQVPEGLVNELGIPLNKGNIYIAKSSPDSVYTAYLECFEKDFALFLRSRSREITVGGLMVLNMMGSDKKTNSRSHTYTLLELLGMTLNEMVKEGLVKEKKLDTFNMPFYAPAEEEIRHVIEIEGSFDIHQFEIIKVDWDANMDRGDNRGKYVATSIRVVTQSILTSHFGEEIIDDLFERFALKMEEFLEVEKGEYTNMVISLRKKLGE